MSGDAMEVETALVIPPVEVEAAAEPVVEPPSLENADVPMADASDSELSEIEEPEEDIGEVLPETVEDGVPIFKPSFEQFKNFTLYMNKVTPYGMKSGIVKVIPPQEWLNKQPPLDEIVKTIKIREPIKQEIQGVGGKYRQLNVLHQRSYNLPQWRQLCDQSEHQPPARRGEVRPNQEPAVRPPPKPKAVTPVGSAKKRKPGRPFKNKMAAALKDAEADLKVESSTNADGAEPSSSTMDRLPTPDSPAVKPEEDVDNVEDEADDEDDAPARGGRMGGMRQPKAVQSVSSRRKNGRREAAGKIDEESFKDFDFKLHEEYSKERCAYLEDKYWKTLTYASPYYGADMLGTLFDDRTTEWNLGRLENILDVLGAQIPGVNTAYLYLGMWKATFAWHLEDVDLYSINYLHFGAPKQWYSISQKDARKFEAAMANCFPEDAKSCDQFLRHKTFLISPSTLLNQYGVRVNKVVHHPGEFVITFPYGYHSGYNLGYNCAEAVNFGLENWLEYGRIAKKCDCDQAQDSVWINVKTLERKLRGEDTESEFEEETDLEGDDDGQEGPTDLPTPPESSGDTKPRRIRKRRRIDPSKAGSQHGMKRIRIRITKKEPCALCPNDNLNEPLLPTNDGRKIHKKCAEYIPETEIDDGVVIGSNRILKARLELKCNFCRSRKGACFQCSQKKCTRSYHPTCAAAAGVFVEQGEARSFGPDGTEYKQDAVEFSCRFHRTKRDKKVDDTDLRQNDRIRQAAAAIGIGEIVQWQPLHGEIFAGSVIHNDVNEEILYVQTLPAGDRLEVPYRLSILPDPADYHIIKPSENAIPIPKSANLSTSQRHQDDLVPRPDDVFSPGFVWKEFECFTPDRNAAQVNVDLAKENQIWYYLGKTSTEAKAQFTEDPTKPRHNARGHFLDTLPKPIPAVIKMQPRQSFPASFPKSVNQNALNAARTNPRPILPPGVTRPGDKPYVYKPRAPPISLPGTPDQGYRSTQSQTHHSSPAYGFGSDPRFSDQMKDRPPNPYLTYTRPASSNSTGPIGWHPSTSVSQARPQHSTQQSGRPVNPFSRPAQPSGQTNKFTHRPDPFFKYAYLQKEHNRAATDYRSPYAPGGGFMNGYEGDLKAHYQKNPDALFHRSGATLKTAANISLPYGGKQTYVPPPVTYSSRGVSSISSSVSNKSGSSAPYKPAPYKPMSDSKASPPVANVWEKKDPSQLHPAIRPSYSGSMFHQQYQPTSRSDNMNSTEEQSVSQQNTHFKPVLRQSTTPILPPQYQRSVQAAPAISSTPAERHPYQLPPLQLSGGQTFPSSQNSPSYNSSQSTQRDKPHITPPELQAHPSNNISSFESPSQSYSQSTLVSTDTCQNSPNPPSSHPLALGSQRPPPPKVLPQLPQAHLTFPQIYRAAPAQDGHTIYAHQQYFQKPATPPTALPPLRDIPDVPADSTSLVEQMMANLRRASSGTK